MTPEYGAATQLEKIDMLDFADVIAINKFDKRGASDALRDVKKQYRRNNQRWEDKDEDLPVFGTIASQFNDPGTNSLYRKIVDTLNAKCGTSFTSNFSISAEQSEKIYIIPPHRTRYLSEIRENNERYDLWTAKQARVSDQLYGLFRSISALSGKDINEPAELETLRMAGSSGKNAGAESDRKSLIEGLFTEFDRMKMELDPKVWSMLMLWSGEERRYKDDNYTYLVRGKEVKVPNYTESLSHLRIPKVALPKFRSWGDRVRWARVVPRASGT
jgi:methylmalonyl-CoA mutase